MADHRLATRAGVIAPRSARRASALGLLALAGLPPPAFADEVRVLAAGAAQHAVQAVAMDFEQATGHRLRASFDTVGAQRDRVLRAAPGAVADVVILGEAAVPALRAAGHLRGEPLALGRVEVALAVPRGAPLPPLADAGQLRAALLAAPSLAHADPARGATAGAHFARTLKALGIEAAVAPKLTVLPFGGDVIEGVAQGRFAIGVSQSSEISAHPGVQLAGPLPPPHGLATAYAAMRVSDAAAGQALIEHLRMAVAAGRLRASGLIPAP